MSQNLILPINKCVVNAGYKMPAYTELWGFKHYGIDLGHPDKQRTVYSPGKGRVIDCGMDGEQRDQGMGIAVVIVFRDVERNDGEIGDLACRMFHFDRLEVNPGQYIERGDVIGAYGSTGGTSSGPHLHVEFDTDVDHPAYAVGIKQGGKVIKKGNKDTTVDPSRVWFVGQGQELLDGWDGTGVSSGWIAQNDLDVPRLYEAGLEPEEPEPEPAEPDLNHKALYEAERQKVEALKNGIRDLIERCRAMLG